MKKLVSITLALVLVLSSISALAISNDYRDYVNWPIADNDVTIRIGLGLNASASDWSLETNWFFNWAMEKTGLKFEFDTVQSSAMNERKSLMFASNELPDVLWGFNLTPVEMVKYGVNEEQLMALNQYITPEIMPNLCKWMEAYPKAVENVTAPDGNIYTLPYFYKVTNPVGGSTRIFISDMYLADLGIEKPQSLAELNEALYAFKAAHPDQTPIGAAVGDYDIRDYFLNAMGYLTDGKNDYGASIAIKDGKVVVPAADETFYEFLKLMNQYYNDGIIYQDYFLLDSDTVEADIKNGQAMLQEGTTFGSSYEEWLKWSAAYPLTSDFNTERKWLSSNLFKNGGFALSAEFEHPVEMLKFMDFFYTDLGAIWCWNGPVKGHEDTMGMKDVGYYINDEGNIVYVGVENGTYESGWPNNLHLTIPTGLVVGLNTCSLNPELNSEPSLTKALAGYEDTKFQWDVTGNVDNYFRASMEEFVSPYEVTDYPYYVFLDAEKSDRLTELATVIDPYVQTEVAEFITGARPLNEFEQFVTELESMGIREYEEIYQAAIDF